MCMACIIQALPDWERFNAEQQAASSPAGLMQQDREWVRMEDAAEAVTSSTDISTATSQHRPELTPLQSGSAQGGTAGGISESLNQDLVDYLVYGGGSTASFWQDSIGNVAQTITYGFPTSGSFATGYGEATGWSAFTSDQQDAARLAIGMWDDLVAVTFVEANGNSSDIKFSNTTTNIGYAHAYFPGTVNAETGAIQKMQGAFWANPTYNASYQSNDLVTPQVGDHGFETFIHELGHALGLGHAGNYNGGDPQYGNTATGWLYAEDSTQYTIMSYFNASEIGADWGDDLTWPGYIWDNSAQTPMVYDILAIQNVYDADYTTRADDTTYGFNSTVSGPVYDFSANATPVLTIWDGDGNDTIDLSGWSSKSTLSLVAGAYSSVNRMTFNLAIAYDVDIENAITGAGNDEITGNDLNNVLAGNDGDDIIDGHSGNDSIYGGADGDWLSGGAGLDWIYGGTGVDWLYGGSDTDALFGEDDGDHVWGGDGGDSIDGGFGNDELHGDAGIDWLYGSFGDDQLFGDDDGDALFGQEGQDELHGGDGGDSLDGGAGNDTLYGDAGIDWLHGGIDNDQLYGGADTDALFGEDGRDALYGGDGGDSLDGGADDDSLLGEGGVDWLFGGTGNDALFGGDESDVLFGEEGDDELQGGEFGDTLDGGAGNDILDGGEGIDVLYGGNGADTFFIFNVAHGGDVIRDFLSGEDKLYIDPLGFGIDPGMYSGQINAPMFSSGNGLPSTLDSGPQFYLETGGQGLWFDATGGDTGDLVIVAGFETGVPQFSDIYFDNPWV